MIFVNMLNSEDEPCDQCFLCILSLNPHNNSKKQVLEIKPVNPKGNQPRIFIGRTDAETEAPVLWPPDAKSQLVGKDFDAGKD